MKKFLESLPEGGRILLWFFLIAFFGGGTRAILHRKPTTRWIDVLAQALASGFTGFVVGTSLIHWWGEQQMDFILALVGLSGWIGPALMDYFGSIAQLVMKRRLGEAGLPTDPPENKDKP